MMNPYALTENEREAMWFIDEFGRMFSVEHYCARHYLCGTTRLVGCLEKGNTADIGGNDVAGVLGL